VKNKLWYFTAYRKRTQQTIFNTFNDDGTPLHSRNGWYQDVTGRLTHQADKTNKVNYSQGERRAAWHGKERKLLGASPLTTTAACSTLYPRTPTRRR
jgi:hypothetical protein